MGIKENAKGFHLFGCNCRSCHAQPTEVEETLRPCLPNRWHIHTSFLRIHIIRQKKVFHMTLHYSSFYLTDCPENIIIIVILFLVGVGNYGSFLLGSIVFTYLYETIYRQSGLELVLFLDYFMKIYECTLYSVT